MSKYLITGFSGFVSEHFLDYLNSRPEKSSVLGIDIVKPHFELPVYDNLDLSFENVNLLEKEQAGNIIFQFEPDYILHLASFSSVAFSWVNPTTSYLNNTNIFLNVLESVRANKLKSRIISVGSSEEYGIVDREKLPLVEDSPLNPISPYAVARAAQEWLSKVYINGYGLDIIMTRSFNHFGPRQREIFVLASLAKQLVRISKEKQSNEILCGDLSVVRDFIDVRDVVEAYFLLFQKSRTGEIYNICSGVGFSLSDLLKKMCSLLNIQVKIKIMRELVRPSDNPVIIGSNSKIFRDTGWIPKISIDKSLLDIINYWMNCEHA